LIFRCGQAVPDISTKQVISLPPFVIALAAVFIIEVAIFGAYAAWLTVMLTAQ
jgi:hypothetical protein